MRSFLVGAFVVASLGANPPGGEVFERGDGV
jgi:hypothetical protein